MSEAKSKEDLVTMAKLSEQAERYDDMMKQMKELAQLREPLSSEERNLFSVAYKNVVGARRSAWRVLVSIKQREDERASDESKKRAKQADDYINKISEEIRDICNEVVELVNDCLLPSVKDDGDMESKTFYLKMKGDYYRYVAEVIDSDSDIDNSENANEAYKDAYEICKGHMDAAHPIRLGLALNYSVFFYEIKTQHQKACEIAKEAFDDAIKQMDENPDDKKYKDSTLIMQLLRDNLSLWTASEADDDDDQMQG